MSKTIAYVCANQNIQSIYGEVVFDMRILTIVPCYNAERYVGEVIKSTKKFNKDILLLMTAAMAIAIIFLKKLKVLA